MCADRPPNARVLLRRLDVTVPVEAAAVSFAQAEGPAILESSCLTLPYARYSLFACEPIEVIESPPNDPDPLATLFDGLARYPKIAAPPDVPFAGGWIGFATYEAGLATEGISATSARDTPGRSWMPAVRFALYDTVAVYDHHQERWSVVAIDWPDPIRKKRPPAKERLERIRGRLESSLERATDTPKPTPSTSRPTANLSDAEYLASVRRAQEYIRAGDIYQVNLTRRFAVRTDATPLAIYRRLRNTSPSSHAALLMWDDTAIVSSSPELFLHLRDGHVVTRPIKGTRPRGEGAAADEALKDELANSTKDRAELAMIVDLLRNDLGRVCRFGTVRVQCPGTIETHPTVFHRTATIEGELRPECTYRDLLRATFPGGSVTGVPKIRAMQIIDELEPTKRGVYCGTIGWIGLDGAMALNIAIRTMVQTGDTVHLHAGGAIVADSDPAEEAREVDAKAAGMLKALGCYARAATRPRMEVPS